MSAPFSFGPLNDIINDAAELFGVPIIDLKSARREAPLARVRFAISWTGQKATRASLPEIGRALGGRDHTTILAGVRRAEDLREGDSDFKAKSDEMVRRARERAGIVSAEGQWRELVVRCREYTAMVAGPVRAVAGDLGYYVSFRGGGQARFELVAVPWSPEAAPAEELETTVRTTIAAILGSAFYHSDQPLPIHEPHGRLRWPIQLGGDASIDLSVLPRQPEEKVA